MQAKERNDTMIEYTQSAEMHAETTKFQLGSRSDLVRVNHVIAHFLDWCRLCG